MRRIFWDRFTQSLLPPPDPSGTATAADATSTSGGGSAAGAGGGGGDGGGAETEGVAEVPGLPSLRVGSKVHSRYGSERGSYYVATVLAVTKGFVDVRYDEDGMVERGVPVSRLKKKNDPPDFEPLLALLGEVRGRYASMEVVPCVCLYRAVAVYGMLLCSPLRSIGCPLG